MLAAIGDAVEHGENYSRQRHAPQQDIKTDHGLLLPSSMTLTMKNVSQMARPVTAKVIEKGRSARN